MFNPARACELLVGLSAVNILDVTEPVPGRLEVTVESLLGARETTHYGTSRALEITDGRRHLLTDGDDQAVVELATLMSAGQVSGCPQTGAGG